MLLKFHEDFQEFCAINEDYIRNKAQEEMYEEWNYLDDFDVGNLEVPQRKFESVAEWLYEKVMDYPEYMLDKMVERPKHFYDVEIWQVPESFIKFKPWYKYYKRLGENYYFWLLLKLL